MSSFMSSYLYTQPSNTLGEAPIASTNAGSTFMFTDASPTASVPGQAPAHLSSSLSTRHHHEYLYTDNLAE